MPPKQKTKKWTDDELAHALAWVDRCKKDGDFKDPPVFKDTVADYLVEKKFDRRTFEAIETKLYHYKVDDNEMLETPHTQVLLEKGTEILPKLKEGFYLATRVKKIKAELAAEDAQEGQNDRGDQNDQRDQNDQDNQDNQDGMEDPADGRVREGFHSLVTSIQDACESLIVHDFQTGSEKLQLLATIPFPSLWSAWSASKLRDSREQFLRSSLLPTSSNVSWCRLFPQTTSA
ncbi:hypothetical protein PG993_002566 [Apiospora rasikravindrae]|uniref:Uncharacterized protein n=1 Tax=Apiospora rasikravindrae TaxID=990691 RepID=A0ABR1TX07_9PEZI